MHGLNTIMMMNSRAWERARAEAISKAKDAPPPVPRERRRLGWFTDGALVRLRAELRTRPGGPGTEAMKLMDAIDAEMDYRRREARIAQAAPEKEVKS